MSLLKNVKQLLSIILIALLVTYALIVYLPHGHDCLETDCAVCNIINSSKDILFCASLLATLQLLPRIISILPALHERIILFREETPVGLKVKLSD